MLSQIRDEDDNTFVIGRVRDRFGNEPSVLAKNFAEAISALMKPHISMSNRSTRRKVGVLISKSGTNLQVLIDHTNDPNVGSCADIAVVISNKLGVKGFERAEKAGIPTAVIPHKDYPTREAYNATLMETLESY